MSSLGRPFRQPLRNRNYLRPNGLLRCGRPVTLLGYRRKEVFLALVYAQDQKMDVAQSRKLMVERFGVTESELLQIELEGMEKPWPPLE